MNSATVILIAVVAVTASALSVPPPPPGNPDIPEECRPKPPQPGKEMVLCCELPRPVSPDNDKFKETFSQCRKQVVAAHPEIEPPHHHGPPPPPPSGSPPPPPHGGPPHQHMMFFHCIDECFFNKTGFLTEDMKLNEESIKETLAEVLEAESVWKTVVDEAVHTCVNASNSSQASSEEEEEVCSSGPHKFIKCITRQMYLNCPTGVWQDNDECKEEKELVEKCPNLPRPPHPPHPPKKND